MARSQARIDAVNHAKVWYPRYAEAAAEARAKGHEFDAMRWQGQADELADVLRREGESVPAFVAPWDEETGMTMRTNPRRGPRIEIISVERLFPSGMWEIIGEVDGSHERLRTDDESRADAIESFKQKFRREGPTDVIEIPVHENAPAKMRVSVESFAEADRVLGRKESMTLGNNTTMRRISDDDIAIILHHTRIVTYHRDGSVTLNSGGYRTVTTRGRINTILPRHLGVSQQNYEWWLEDRRDGSRVKFFDGMRVRGG